MIQDNGMHEISTLIDIIDTTEDNLKQNQLATLVYLDIYTGYLAEIVSDEAIDDEEVTDSLNMFITLFSALMYKSVEFEDFEFAALSKTQIQETISKYVPDFDFEIVKDALFNTYLENVKDITEENNTINIAMCVEMITERDI